MKYDGCKKGIMADGLYIIRSAEKFQFSDGCTGADAAGGCSTTGAVGRGMCGVELTG